MHRRFTGPAFAVAALLALLAASAGATAPEKPASPDWELARADGSQFVLSEQVGERPFVLLFWATWCPYCKALMPHIESMVLEHNMGADFEVLAITIGEDGDPAAFLKEKGYDFTLLPDGEDVAKLYGIRGTPGVLIIDREGRVAFDLRDQRAPSFDTTNMKRRDIAARRAPYWAAQIRRALDDALSPR